MAAVAFALPDGTVELIILLQHQARRVLAGFRSLRGYHPSAKICRGRACLTRSTPSSRRRSHPSPRWSAYKAARRFTGSIPVIEQGGRGVRLAASATGSLERTMPWTKPRLSSADHLAWDSSPRAILPSLPMRRNPSQLKAASWLAGTGRSKVQCASMPISISGW